MSRRVRIFLLILAGALLLAALLLLSSALAPGETASLSATLAPTYLTPPVVSP